MALYGKRKETSLNDLRYSQYLSSSYKSKTSIAQRVTKIPEQVGVGKHKEWSRSSTNHFEPCAGRFLVKQRQRNCRCRKAGLHCSPICASCEGLCDNVEPLEDSIDIDEEETEERDREQTKERLLTRCGRYD